MPPNWASGLLALFLRTNDPSFIIQIEAQQSDAPSFSKLVQHPLDAWKSAIAATGFKTIILVGAVDTASAHRRNRPNLGEEKT